MVYTNNEGWSFFIFCRSRDNNFLCTSFDVSGSFFGCCEYTSGFYNILSAALSPWNFAWVFAVIYVDCMTVYNEFAIFYFECAVKLTMHGVIFCHVNHVIKANKWIVNTYYFKYIRLSHCCTEY